MWASSVLNPLLDVARASLGRAGRRAGCRRPVSRRLSAEALEDRTLLSATLLGDINPGSASSNPDNLRTALGDRLFFAATAPGTGRELWKSDGTPEGTVRVKDIFPGSGSSSPLGLTVVGDRLFFIANDGTSGPELWKSDGTPEGTVRVKDINPGSAGSALTLQAVVGDRLFFLATTATAGREPWVSDGTEEGTFLLRDINPGSASSNPGNLRTALGDRLFFAATAPGTGRELWKSDGTVAGTVLVKDIRPGSAGSSPYRLTNVGGTLLFVANGDELWKSDGTSEGTVFLQDLGDPDRQFTQVGNLTDVSGMLVFSTRSYEESCDEVGCFEFNSIARLWKSDGTGAGTVVLREFPADLTPDRFLTDVGGTLFFTAYDGAGLELWKSDGTPEGTVRVKDINPGSASSDPVGLTNVNGTLFFTAISLGAGGELWKSDGTEAGTVQVKDINPGTASSDPVRLTALGDRLFFLATTATAGQELWVSDGTPEGTTLVQDIRPGTGSSDPQLLTAVGGRLFFTADDLVHGRELWVVVPERVASVVINDGSAQRARVTSITVLFSGLVTIDSGAFELYRADGSLVGVDVYTGVYEGWTWAYLVFHSEDVIGGSLADGSYVLVIQGSLIHDGLGQELDGDDDGLDGGNRVERFFRLFGDSDGDGDVDESDQALFDGTLGLSAADVGFLAYFDFDGDGDVDEQDRDQFLLRLGSSLIP